MGSPLCSIARGSGDHDLAEEIMGIRLRSARLFSVLIMIIGLLFKEPLLWAFGASQNTITYANDYMSIYLLGTPFVLIGLGMNSFINSQGFAKIGMMTVLLGAVTNIILDPIFIFVLAMGVKGAALATVISQFCVCLMDIPIFNRSKNDIEIKKRKTEIKNKTCEKNICFRDGWIYDGIDKFCCHNCL